MKEIVKNYISNLTTAINYEAMDLVPNLAEKIKEAWAKNNTIYFCGNGGSAGNAVHLANDLLYGAGKTNGKGIRVEALSANPAVLTCLANDVGYGDVYSEQLKVKANPGDVLIVLSGSGNSENIVKALEVGNEMGMHTFAILGYSGGKCKEIAQYPIHFNINDMQISEDIQLIIGHMCMQWLCQQTVG